MNILSAAKYIGAGIACSGLIGAGVRIGLIFLTCSYAYSIELY